MYVWFRYTFCPKIIEFLTQVTNIFAKCFSKSSPIGGTVAKWKKSEIINKNQIIRNTVF
jgi:hypothetical protein